MRVCSESGCPTLTTSSRCPAHTRARDQARGRRQQRGYGADHTRERARWEPLVRQGLVNCSRCGQPIKATVKWDLDHDDSRAGYRGPSHSTCNRSAGGRASHA